MRILVLDDQSSLSSVLKQSFQAESVIIDSVFTAEMALRRLRAASYDWLVTDLIMEGMNGVDLVQTALKENLIAQGRIVVATSLSENTILIRAIRDYGIRILQKPVTVEQIKDALQ